jgi:hypothetical protein
MTSGGKSTAAIAAAAIAVGVGGSKLPLKPLSTLGRLEPAQVTQSLGPEGIPIPAAKVLAPPGPDFGVTVDGVRCGATEQVAYHIHARLSIFGLGKPRQVPLGIGIVPPRELQGTPVGPFVVGGRCFYWLHTHASDGIIHIESPTKRTYTLGNFFDVWGQPLSAKRVGPLRGKVTAIFNGKVFAGNPRNIPLEAHAQIQLEVGKPLVVPLHIANWNGL